VLQDVYDLANAVDAEACLHLPLKVQKQTAWTSAWTILPACLMGYVVLVFQWPLLATRWWVAALCLAGTAGAFRWHMRRSAYRVHWKLDIAQRRLQSVEPGSVAVLLDASHSIGCISGPLHHGGISIGIELRHRTLGPLATLCSVDIPTPLGSNLTSQLTILDNCVDRLVDRLEIRRSGARLIS